MTAAELYLIPAFIGVLVLAVRTFRLRRLVNAKKCRIAHLESVIGDEALSSLYHRISAERADTGLVVQTLDGTVMWANPAYLRIMRRSAEEVIGKDPFLYAFAPENRPSPEEIANFRFDPDDYDHETNVVRENIRGDGQPVWLRIRTSFHNPHSDNALAILACHDVTEEIQREAKLRETTEELAHIAGHDHLTGAANRVELARFLKDALAKAQNEEAHVGVLHIDLDRFKQINDTHGHSAGDAVLVAVADRVRAKVRETDMFARIGGDEFVVVCPNLHGLADVQAIGHELIEAVSRPVAWGNTNLTCQISVGAALSDNTADDLDALLAKSDFALYEVKRTGRGHVATYNSELHNRHSRETQREAALRDAILNKTLTFHYHPIVGHDLGDVRGFETLVRWDHPTDGLIQPNEFLAQARSLGLMAEVDLLAMNAALDLKRRLNDADHLQVRVSFNTSSQALSHPDFCPTLLSSLGFRGLEPHEIIIEVREAVVFENQDGDTPFVRTLAELHAAGVVTVLDDFGSGQAGLAQLANMAVKGVKISKSLTDKVLTDPRTERVYRTLVALCHDLDLTVVTEGVETSEQAGRLIALGSPNLQGHWISRPMPRQDVLPWLEARHASAIAPARTPRYLRG